MGAARPPHCKPAIATRRNRHLIQKTVAKLARNQSGSPMNAGPIRPETHLFLRESDIRGPLPSLTSVPSRVLRGVRYAQLPICP